MQGHTLAKTLNELHRACRAEILKEEAFRSTSLLSAPLLTPSTFGHVYTFWVVTHERNVAGIWG